MPLPHHLGFRRGEPAERGQGLFSPALLDDAQRRVQHHDRHNRPCLKPITKQCGNHCGDQKEDDDKVVQLIPEHLPERRLGRFGQLAQAIFSLAADGLCRR